MEPREGDVVTHNVRLVRLLGRGGMGSVWVARHESLDVDVAVKFVSKELLSGGDPLVVERFRREAKLAAKIESQHVVRVFDHGVTKEGTPYIVMEMLRGESLAERLGRFTRMGVMDVARVVSEIATGLSAAHAMGVVHRDIKPHNVFLARSRDGVEIAKILDFGIAKTTNPGEEVLKAVKTSSGVLIGTPQYMSPEQLMRAGPADKGADLWALAVVAYEAVTGKVPFAGETLAATLIAITRAEIQPPTSAVPEAPAGLDTFFARALAADASKRFSTAAELAAAFAEAAGGIASAPAVPSSDVVTRPVPDVNTSPDLTTAEFVAMTAPGSKRGVDVHGSSPPTSGPVEPYASTRVDDKRTDDAATSTEPAPTKPSAEPRTADITQPSVSDGSLRSSTPAGPTSNRNRMLVIGGVVVVGLGAYFLTRSPPPTPPPTPQTSTSPSTSETSVTTPPPTSSVVAPSATSAAPPKRAVAAFKKQVVKDGRTEDKTTWVPDFWVQRDPPETGLSFLAAESSCRAKKLFLCSDLQFERACASYPELANDTAWTITSEALGIVVRGGESGCATRKVVPTDDVDPERSSLCCTRAVALNGDLDKFGVLRNAANQVLMYESSFNAGNGEKIAKDATGSIGFFNQTMTPEKLAETIVWMSKSLRIVQEQCKLTLVPQDPDKGWQATCTGMEMDIAKTEPKNAIGVKQVFQRFEFAGSGVIRDIRTWQHPRRLILPPE